ncbi:RNA guanylyltransferase [Hepatocystis sp. ex Piliocolobus tephrosceles]|nr:RNA guanylyltransferase [Hepatocystis sp. ex Piliocolobus tephrosceles]
MITDIYNPGEIIENEFLKNKIRTKVNEMLRWKRRGFPGSNPVSLTKHNLKNLFKKEYLICEKTDGVRYLLLVASNTTFLIDRNYEIYKNNMHIPTLHNLDEKQQLTLLEGELVNDVIFNKKKEIEENKFVYLIYDGLYIQRKDITNLSYLERLKNVYNYVITPLKLYKKRQLQKIIKSKQTDSKLNKYDIQKENRNLKNLSNTQDYFIQLNINTNEKHNSNNNNNSTGFVFNDPTVDTGDNKGYDTKCDNGKIGYSNNESGIITTYNEENSNNSSSGNNNNTDNNSSSGNNNTGNNYNTDNNNNNNLPLLNESTQPNLVNFDDYNSSENEYDLTTYEKELPFEIYLKDFYSITQIPELIKAIKKIPHATDGIIFTPLYSPYVTGNCYDLLKWKPLNLNTVDFGIETVHDENNLPNRFELYIAIRGVRTSYKCYLAQYGEVYKNLLELALTSQISHYIIECYYISKNIFSICKNDNNTEKIVEGGWVAQKIRYDKNLPNDIVILNKVMQSIIDNINLDSLIKEIARNRKIKS